MHISQKYVQAFTSTSHVTHRVLFKFTKDMWLAADWSDFASRLPRLRSLRLEAQDNRFFDLPIQQNVTAHIQDACQSGCPTLRFVQFLMTEETPESQSISDEDEIGLANGCFYDYGIQNTTYI